ncbi:leader peptidase (prepilin peptidase)/N-methyltransferase [Streptomyces sp. PsTaAH-137]|uniref:prepilin peptidase n=2 Tax=unclassified Streptomyces TaxID=2593676 RepID=UPI000DC5184C|nr:A24 family peptidase [Streptomyces sp. PsTaAH-137]RAJ76998.1 leader peptidase (prepilin peptidase)/N-methyltransferase [Streptomyces sp. PsTaAH-137]
MLAITVAAATWGAVSGWCTLAALHRLAVPAGTEWRTTCPEGHQLPAGARGWVAAYCTAGAHQYPAGARAVATPAAVMLGSVAMAIATGPRPELLVWLLLIPIGVLLALVDYRVHRLPDVLTLPLAGSALVLLGLASLLPGAAGSWTGSLLGASALGVLFLIMFLASPRAMGFGDVKLALALGAVLGWHGWRVLLLGVLAGYLIAAAQGVLLIARRKGTVRTAIPFGPPLLMGALIGVAASGLLG